jgi:hypothetical protein
MEFGGEVRCQRCEGRGFAPFAEADARWVGCLHGVTMRKPSG